MLEVLALCLTYYPVSFFDIARPALPLCSIGSHAGGRDGKRRLRRPGHRDRPAMARLLRDGRSSRVGRGRVAAYGSGPCRTEVREWMADRSDRRDHGAGDGVPDSLRAGRQRRHHPAGGAFPAARRLRGRIRGTGSFSRATRTASHPRFFGPPQAPPRLGEHTGTGVHSAARATEIDDAARRLACRSRAFASWT